MAGNLPLASGRKMSESSVTPLRTGMATSRSMVTPYCRGDVFHFVENIFVAPCDLVALESSGLGHGPYFEPSELQFNPWHRSERTRPCTAHFPGSPRRGWFLSVSPHPRRSNAPLIRPGAYLSRLTESRHSQRCECDAFPDRADFRGKLLPAQGPSALRFGAWFGDRPEHPSVARTR